MITTAKLDNQIGIRRRQAARIRPLRRRSIRGRAQAGASLIEIMVVLVILLVGVFLAIRIFPAGFGVLQANDNRSRAVRLAEQLMGDAQNNVASLPQGVLMEGVTATGTAQPLNPILNQDPDSLATYTFADNTTASDVNKTRFIKGEPIKIPVATSTIGTGAAAAVPGSQYTLRFGPISLEPTTVGFKANAPTSTNQALYDSYLKVMSAPLVGYNVSSNNPTITAQPGTMATPVAYSTAPPIGADGVTNVSGYLRGQTSYLVDYSSGTNPALIMFAGNLDKVTFYVSYSYQPTAGTIQTVTDQALYVNQGSTSTTLAGTPVWQGLPLPTSVSTTGVATSVVPGSVSVRRAFTRVANPSGGPTWTASPYEYCLGQDNTSSTANIGQIYFNPAGANYSVPTPSGQQPFMAYADYSVLDWHILHDDVQVPSISVGTLGLIPAKTSFSQLKRTGDANPDQTIYSGIYNDTSGTDIAVFNLGTGTVLTNTSSSGALGNVIHGVATPDPTGTGAPDYYIDTDPHQGTYETGTVYLNPNTTSVSGGLAAGSQVRILYKADGDWAVALQKAYSQYLPVAGAATPPTWISSTDGTGVFNGFSIDSGNYRIYFPKSDLNKSVVVSLQYKLSTNGTTSSYVRVPPTQFVIDNVSGNYAYIDLFNGANASTLSTADQTGIKGDTAWNVTGPILGVSVKARVIYKDNNNTNNSWRVQDIDTYLTPAS